MLTPGTPVFYIANNVRIEESHVIRQDAAGVIITCGSGAMRLRPSRLYTNRTECEKALSALSESHNRLLRLQNQYPSTHIY